MEILKRNIAIVCGGDSSEHDVSIRSAQGLYSFFDKERYNVYMVDVKKNDWHVNFTDGSIAKIDKNDFSFQQDGHKVTFDYAYLTIHGTPGENGIMQGYFDLIGMPYSTSDVLVEALTFNKFALNNFLRAFPELHISDSVMVRKGDNITPDDEKQIAERLGIPCFVKPNAGGSSFGVTKVKHADALRAAIDKAMMESDEVMIEKMMSGTEITCGCFKRANGEIVTLPITEVVCHDEFFDYDAKYNNKSDEITLARIAPETAQRASDMTKRIYHILGCYGLIRIDYILSGEKGQEQINMLEINTTPGMTATSFIPQQVRASEFEIKDVLSEIIEGKF